MENVVVLQKLLKENNKFLPQIQKISSSNEFVAFAMRFYKKNLIIYLGRGGNGNGIYLSNVNIPASLRIKDRYLDFLRSTLANGYIEDILCHPTEKILQIKLQKFEENCRIGLLFLIYWKGRESYFVVKKESESHSILKSWIGNWQNLDYPLSDNFEYFQEVLAPAFVKSESRAKDLKIITNDERFKGYFDFQLNKIENNIRKKKISKQEKKIKNITEDYQRLEMWAEFYEFFKKNEEEVLKDSLAIISYKNLKFKIDYKMSYYHKRSWVYEKCKKAINNIVRVNERINKEKSYLEQLKKLKLPPQNSIGNYLGKIIVPVWRFSSDSKTSEVNEKKTDNSTILQTTWGEVAIGKNAQGNDTLRKNWARKDDLWFHVDNETSAHLFLKMTNNNVLSAHILEIIGSILKDYSRLNSDEINLVYTKIQYLKSIKGRPGAVTFKNEKRIKVYYNSNWKEIISAPL